MAGANPNHGLPRVQNDAVKLTNFSQQLDGDPFPTFRVDHWDRFRAARAATRVDSCSLLECLDGTVPMEEIMQLHLLQLQIIAETTLWRMIFYNMLATRVAFKVLSMPISPQMEWLQAKYILTPGVGPIAFTSGHTKSLQSDWLKMDMPLFSIMNMIIIHSTRGQILSIIEALKFTTLKTMQQRADKSIDGLIDVLDAAQHWSHASL